MAELTNEARTEGKFAYTMPCKEEERMSEIEKMLSHEFYDYTTPEIVTANEKSLDTCTRFNATPLSDPRHKELLCEMIPAAPESTIVMPPFHCDFGTNIHLGENVFINFNVSMLDGGGITIGKNTLIGPNCSLFCSQHPLDYKERLKPIVKELPIIIGDNCWLGGNVIVVGGVTIGARSVIAAGSVVVKDIPEDSLAAGNPARVIRKLR